MAPANNTANREGNKATDTPVAANANILPGTTARRPKQAAEESREDLTTGVKVLLGGGSPAPSEEPSAPRAASRQPCEVAEKTTADAAVLTTTSSPSGARVEQHAPAPSSHTPATTEPNPPFNPAQLQALLALLQQHAPVTAGTKAVKRADGPSAGSPPSEEPSAAPRRRVVLELRSPLQERTEEPYLPATDLTLALYLVYALNKHATLSAITLTCSAVAFAHKMTGLTCPTNDPFTSQVREFAKRHSPRPNKTKEPVSLHQVHQMTHEFIASNIPSVFQKGLIPLLMYTGFLRFSDLVAIQWQDIQFEEAAMWLLIPHSKTDQEGKGIWVPIATTSGTYCPVNITRQFISLAGYDASTKGPLIRVFTRDSKATPHDHAPSYPTVRNWCLEAFKKVGLNANHLGTHSFRKGAATTTAGIGVSDRMFKRLGRWRSNNAKDLYVTIAHDQLVAASQLIQDPTRAPSPNQHQLSIQRHRRPTTRLSQKAHMK
ncbi:unnamed protein product [Closterium sp. NIES-53]